MIFWGTVIGVLLFVAFWWWRLIAASGKHDEYVKKEFWEMKRGERD